MSELADIIEAKAEEFDALREIFFPDNSVLKLLKVSETINDFETIETLTADWYLEYSEFRQQFRLSIARNSEDFTAKITAATHVSVNAEVYTIKTADTLPPMGETPVWNLFCERFFSENQFSNLY